MESRKMFLSDLSIKRPIFAAVMMLALVILGIFSYRRLAIDMFPDVEIPVLSIITKYPGASPETVEREVSHASPARLLCRSSCRAEHEGARHVAPSSDSSPRVKRRRWLALRCQVGTTQPSTNPVMAVVGRTDGRNCGLSAPGLPMLSSQR